MKRFNLSWSLVASLRESGVLSMFRVVGLFLFFSCFSLWGAPKASEGVQAQWFGHSFVYLTSQNGIRVAIDPYTDVVKLPFPKNLVADVVLISYEGMDRDAGERLYGSPQIFRSVTGIGANNACGNIFRGVESYRDASQGRELGKNTIFVFELDGIRFCHLGGLGYPLDTRKVDEIGRVDVLFLPVGNKQLTASEWRTTAEKLQAKWIVPIAYQNEKADLKELRPLEEFLEEFKLHQEGTSTRKVEDNTYVFRKQEIPSKPTLLLLPSP